MIPLALREIASLLGGRLVGAGEARAVGVATDSRTIRPGELFVAIAGPRYDGHDYVNQALQHGACGALVSDGWDDGRTLDPGAALIRVSETVTALGRLGHGHRRRLTAKVIGVTGSNGKTTAARMIHAVLAQRFTGQCSPKSYNNHIGVPLTLLSATQDDEYLVSEIGSNAPGEVAALGRMAAPDVVVVTSIGEAHLHGFGDVGGVAAEKLSLLACLADHGFAVIHQACMEFVPRSVRTDHDLTTFGTGASADALIGDVRSGIGGTSFTLRWRRATLPVRLALPGAHNAANAAPAVIIGRRLGVPDEEIVEALARVRPADKRLNVVRCGSVTLIDDSYNANPASMAAAIGLLGGVAGRRRVMVAGEMGELGEATVAAHRQLGRRIADAGIELLIAVGAHAAETVRAAGRVRSRIVTAEFGTTRDACDDIENLLRAGDVVLVKGSRMMELEMLSARVRDLFAADAGPPATVAAGAASVARH